MNLNLSLNYRTIAFLTSILIALLLSSLFSLFPLPHEYGKFYFIQLVAVILILTGYFLFRKEQLFITFPDYAVLSTIVFGYCTLSALFYDTSFGLWAMQGDAGFNIAIITKFKYNNLWVDFNYRDLHSSYPSLYFFLLGKYAALTNTSSVYMLKKGFLALYLIMPWISYNYLKRVFNAWPAAISVLIFCLFFYEFAIYKPAEFFSLLLFVPWFLNLLNTKEDRSVLINGIVGGLLFATYYFWFLIIPFVVLSYYLIEKQKTQFEYLIKVLSLSAILSSFFWMPVFLDCYKYGFHSQIALWFDESMLVLYRNLDKISVIQVLVVIGILCIVILKDIRRELKWLLLAFVFWLLLGQLSMLIQKPLVHSKMNHLGDLIMIIGFAEGLVIVLNKKFNNATLIPVLSAVVFIAAIQGFSDIKGNAGYKAAFDNYPANEWQKSDKIIDEYKDKVFLTEKTFLNQLLPTYTFINVNAHFSNPACQYLKRIDFLSKLQNCNDPLVVLWLMKYNKFNAIDYVWPNSANQITVFKDNFPYNHLGVSFTFSPQILGSIAVQVNELNSPYFQGTLYKLNQMPYETKNSLNPNYKDLMNEYGL